jgi:hypothetical protein
MNATGADLQAAVTRLITLISPDAGLGQAMVAAFLGADPEASDAGATE